MRGGARCSARLRPLRAPISIPGGGRHVRTLRTSAADSSVRLQPRYCAQRPRIQAIEPRVPQLYPRARSQATVAQTLERSDNGGPIAEYDSRVEAGALRNDEHQRGEDTTQSLG